MGPKLNFRIMFAFVQTLEICAFHFKSFVIVTQVFYAFYIFQYSTLKGLINLYLLDLLFVSCIMLHLTG